jgi:site-specific DNA-methyltransferase (adenine-specific)
MELYNANCLEVMDNLIGVGCGTTGVACLNTDRHFIGIEDKENIFSVAKNRITKIKNNV